MKNQMNIKLMTRNFDISEAMRLSITSQIAAEAKHFPDYAIIELTISKMHNRHWTFNLSMRYSCGHVAITKNEISLEKALQAGLKEFKNDLRLHELQWSVESFHFDKTGELDYMTNISHISLPFSRKKIQGLILEDDPAAAAVLKATLENYGCPTNHFDLPNDALKAIEDTKYDLLILDWNLPYMKGGEFLTAADALLQSAHKPGQPQRRIPVVICTSMPLESIRIPEVEHFFIINYWHKSLPFSSILGSIDETTKQIGGANSEQTSSTL